MRDEPPHPHRLPGRQQVIRPLGPQAVGQREIAIHVSQVQRSNCGQLVDNHVRLRPAHGLRNLLGIKGVCDHRHSAELMEHRLL
jgi:hypothetical protein